MEIIVRWNSLAKGILINHQCMFPLILFSSKSGKTEDKLFDKSIAYIHQ